MSAPIARPSWPTGRGGRAGSGIPWQAVALVVAVLALCGCDTLGYYGQSIEGQRKLLALRRPIPEVISDPATAPAQAEKLRQVQQMREFASEQLGLPVGGSYRHFADVGREVLVWSVVAAPEFSLTPKSWCYLLIGCASYRGYFERAAAAAYAERLRAQRWDVAVEPVPAYSTLGWFDDPLPSTVIGWSPVQIAELLFHELAHRRVYAPGDSAFNEAYATIVAETGVKRWLTRPGRAVDAVEWQRLQAQGRRFDALLQAVRERLEELYASDLPDPERRRLKAQSFRRLQDEYRSARAAGRLTGYDTWFSRELNNAHLASVATYRQWVPAFERLLEELGGDLAAFHVEVERLAALSQPERQAQLAAFH